MAEIFYTGSYIFVETSSPVRTGDTARLESNVVPYSTSARCFKFYYHMYGVNVGDLRVYIKESFGATLLWKLNGNQGNVWNYATIQIQPRLGNFQVNSKLAFFLCHCLD